MGKYQQVWQSLKDEEYRREYSSDVGTGLAFQIKLLREKNGWTQEHLAQRTSRQQETISQWENPNYGRYTLNSLNSLAAAFDVALMVKFVPFSELVKWGTNLTPKRLAPPSFNEEKQASQWLDAALNSESGLAATATDPLIPSPPSAPFQADYEIMTVQPREEKPRAVAAEEKNHALAA